MSMQKIREWMEQNPDGANELRRQNRSYIFFREVNLSEKDEAVGAQGVPLTAGRSIAVDKALHVYGTPFFIEGDLPIESERSKTPFRRLMIAQDTGSAIVGPARADLYFGAGAEAGRVAGRLKNNARFVMLVPKGLDPIARGRKLPVPDERPSERIAKLFPQVAPRISRRLLLRCSNAGNISHFGAGVGPAAGVAAQGRPRPRARREAPPSMKRRWPEIPDLSAGMRRKRSLSEEERKLWESVARQVKPLRASRAWRGRQPLGRKSRLPRPRSAADAFAGENLPTPNRTRRRSPRSAAANARSFHAAGKRSTPASTCTA
jgi:3D (Asp-Asp-Asp) domain-containing protein